MIPPNFQRLKLSLPQNSLAPIIRLTSALILTFCVGFLCGEAVWRLTWTQVGRVFQDNLEPSGPPPLFFSWCLKFPPSPSSPGSNPDRETAWPWRQVEMEASRTRSQEKDKFLYVITPTVRGPVQIPNLVRTAQALAPLRKRVRWLIFEDSNKNNGQTNYPQHISFLRQELRDFTHQIGLQVYWSLKRRPEERIIFTPKGVEGRRDGLARVRKHSAKKGRMEDVLFFGDDDNTYDTDLFRQLLTLSRKNSTVLSWPVGLVTPETRLSSLVLNEDGIPFSVHDGWKVNRKFPMDFGGFAISTGLLLEKMNVTIPYIAGYEESGFLTGLGIELQDIQVLANGATEVLAYHSKTGYVPFDRDHSVKTERNLIKKISKHFKDTNIEDLFSKYDLTRTYRSR